MASYVLRGAVPEIGLIKPKTKDMLKLSKTNQLLTAAVLGAICTSSAIAGDTTMTASKEVVAPVEAEATKVVSGTLTLQANTHFISYGADVWGSGERWNDVLFNPSLELGIELGGGFKFILGTWWDVNDNADSSIGKRVQEVDAWAGLGYTVDKWSFTLLYQTWMYGGETEQIVDFKVAYDTFLNPSLLVHGRTDAGASGGKEGVVLVAGISEGFDLGPVTFSFPINVAFFPTKGFHAAGSDGSPAIPEVPAQFGVAFEEGIPAVPGTDESDSGFGFASAAVNASVPVKFLPGDWTFGVGATYYYTNDEVIPNNRDDSFVTGSAGLTLTF